MISNIQSSISGLVRKSDLFGQEVNLNVNKNVYYKTLVGGYFTWLLIIGFTLFFVSEVKIIYLLYFNYLSFI